MICKCDNDSKYICGQVLDRNSNLNSVRKTANLKYSWLFGLSFFVVFYYYHLSHIVKVLF
jgi:hypothetical protein